MTWAHGEQAVGGDEGGRLGQGEGVEVDDE
jgi:hypothetical protein